MDAECVFEVAWMYVKVQYSHDGGGDRYCVANR